MLSVSADDQGIVLIIIMALTNRGAAWECLNLHTPIGKSRWRRFYGIRCFELLSGCRRGSMTRAQSVDPVCDDIITNGQL